MEHGNVQKIPAARELAYQILLKFDLEKSRIDVLENEFLGNKNIGSKDHKLIKNLVSGVIRNMLYLDWIAFRIYSGKYSKMLTKAKTILRMAFYELIYLDFIPNHATVNEYVKLGKKKLGLNQSKMINAMLRNYLRSKNQHIPEQVIKETDELLSIKYSFPRWLIKRWISLWGEEQTRLLLEKISAFPEFDFQLNKVKSSPEEIEKMLNSFQIPYEKSDVFSETYKIKDMQKLLASGVLANGLGTIQDESAHIPVHLLDLRENDIVLDVCAAPGGKFTQIIQNETTKLIAVAVDIDINRLKKVKTNLDHLGITHANLVVADGRHLPFKPLFTKILLDAPCSGLGVISKHPDIKWRRTMEDIRDFSQLQKELIGCVSEYLVQDGILVYSTCTIDPLEDEDVVNSFLDAGEGTFNLQEIPDRFKKYTRNKMLHTLPHRDAMDGSFAAVLKKK